MSTCIIIFSSSTVTFRSQCRGMQRGCYTHIADMQNLNLHINGTPERTCAGLPVCFSLALSSPFITTVHTELSLHWHPVNITHVCFRCAFAVHAAFTTTAPRGNLKVMPVDLAGVHPLTSPSRLGPGSDWTLTQDSKSLLSLCLSSLSHTLAFAL